MITLAADCLLFRLACGQSLPLSADMISVELPQLPGPWCDDEFVNDAAKGVFHYFRHELKRQSVTMAEFAEALEKVLHGFGLGAAAAATAGRAAVRESDLLRLANESGGGCELLFFPRLREELKQQMQLAPGVLRFHGLRGCVMQLAGTRRWNPRCRALRDQIVDFLRGCLNAEHHRAEISLVVE